MKYFAPVVFFIACIFMSACSSDSDSSSVKAPESLSGITYRLTIESGSGILADTGQVVVTFANTQQTYTVTGDGVNTGDSVGSYIYTRDSNQGTAEFVDSQLAEGRLVFSYESSTGGSYQMTIQSDPASSQTGTFVEI